MDDLAFLATGFQKLCECAVCLETLNNPRTLKCEHSFCKECIDGIAMFKDGNISITCPTCQTEQIMEGEITDLKAVLMVKQMLDLVNRSRKRSEENCSSDACDGEAIRYYDGSYLCKTCSASLPSNLDGLKYDVKFSYSLRTFLPNCVEHDSFQTIVCIYCKRLCCKYCKHYHHDNHITMLLDEYNKAKYEESLLKRIQKTNNAASSYKNIIADFNSQEEFIQQNDSNFAKQIKMRKKEIIAKVLQMVEDIEGKLLKKFENHKSFALMNIGLGKSKCEDEVEELSNLERRIQDYNSKTQLEKYCNFDNILNDLEYFDSIPNTPSEKELTVTFNENNNKDDLLYEDLSEMFGVEVKARGFPDEQTETLASPTKSSKNVLQSDELLKKLLQKYVEMFSTEESCYTEAIVLEQRAEILELPPAATKKYVPPHKRMQVKSPNNNSIDMAGNKMVDETPGDNADKRSVSRRIRFGDFRGIQTNTEKILENDHKTRDSVNHHQADPLEGISNVVDRGMVLSKAKSRRKNAGNRTRSVSEAPRRNYRNLPEATSAPDISNNNSNQNIKRKTFDEAKTVIRDFDKYCKFCQVFGHLEEEC